MQRRLQNIIQRMAGGQIYYFSQYSPRMTTDEAREIEALHPGLVLQEERPMHEVSMCYPLNKATFREAARALGIVA